MKTSYKLCKYPSTGFGNKNNQFYLIDQYGKIIDFKNEYDKVLDEFFWYIEIPVYGQFNGSTIKEIVDTMKANDITVENW